ncbi:MAG: hypothetical protein JXA96_18005 [Sedimentisphaerales bacterium]|nr:hypothetical protein [Sedimentisphaerales bacterium]
MNEFIQKNRSLLKFYHIAAKIIGWVLIGITPIYAFIWFKSLSTGLEENYTFHLLQSIYILIVSFLCFGLIVLGVARFIKYLYSEDSRPGWTLRNLDKFLYLYAFLTATGIYIDFMQFTILIRAITLQDLSLFLFQNIIIKLSHVLIIIGIGHIMSRILSVIEESKTLV